MLAIYRRVSKDEQAENGLSLDNQELRGKELALRLGLKYEVFTDAGFTGSIPYHQRPQLKALIDRIFEKEFTALFVTDLDRLSRGDIVQTTVIKKIIKDNDVKLYDLSGEIKLNDINVELLTDMRGLLNAYELKKMSARIATVLDKNAQDGKASGGPMQKYGYSKDENKYLVIDGEEAEVVKMIFKLATEGKGTKVIANILNERGIPTKRNTSKNSHSTYRGVKKTNFEWIDSTVYHILTSPMYIGLRPFKGKLYPLPHLAIIEDATFDLAQHHLKNRNQFKDTTNRYNYLLKGLIVCPKCGGRFIGKINKAGGNNNYACNSNRKGTSCGNRGINIDFLDNIVCEAVMDMGFYVENALSESNIETTTTMNPLVLDKIETEIVGTKRKIDNLLNLAEEGNIEAATFKERLSERQKELKALETERDKINAEYRIYRQKDNIAAIAMLAIKNFKKCKTFHEKRDFLRNIIHAISIGWDIVESVYGIAIFFKLNDFENYLLSRQLIVDRKLQNGKAGNKILLEKVSLQRLHYLDDEIDKSVYSLPFINLGEPVTFFKFQKGVR